MAKKATPKKRIIKGRDYAEDKRQDGLRVGKRKGWRVSGSNRVPTKKEIQEHYDGLRSDIYMESRPNRSDSNTRAKKGERFEQGGEVNYNYERGKNYPVKTVSKDDYEKLGLEEYPNFSKTGSISGMKKQYYGKDALLVKCGNYIYNVTSNPDIYFNEAYEKGGEIESDKYKKGGKIDRKKSTKKTRVNRTKKAIAQDKNIKALHGGKRISESGSVYYESRPNRSDENRTKKLAKGGELELEMHGKEYAYISSDKLSYLKKEYKDELKNDDYSIFELPLNHPDRKRGNKWGLFKPKSEDDSNESEIDYDRIADLIEKEYTSGYDPNWSISYDIEKSGFEMREPDYEHVAKQVRNGITSGELNLVNSDDEESGGWWTLSLSDSYAKGGSVSKDGDRHKYYIVAYKTEKDFNDRKISYSEKGKMHLNYDDASEKQDKLLEEGYYTVEIKAVKNNRVVSSATSLEYAKGGKLGFEGLAKKVAKEYEGDKVKPEYQAEYGKTYDKEEAKEVAQKVAAKVYREQQGIMEQGGEIKSTLTLSEIESKLGKTFGFWSVPYQVTVDGVEYRKKFGSNIYNKI